MAETTLVFCAKSLNAARCLRTLAVLSIGQDVDRAFCVRCH